MSRPDGSVGKQLVADGAESRGHHSNSPPLGSIRFALWKAGPTVRLARKGASHGGNSA